MTTEVKELNIILSGVGGQGVILMSELLGHAIIEDGLCMQGSEVLGMAQRGGSVFSNIRIGNDLYAPLTPQGKCDILVAVEPSEALRYIKDLSSSSLVIINTTKVLPFTVSIGQSSYPDLDTIVSSVKKVTKNVITLDATRIAEQAGNLLTTNTVMLGALFGSGRLPIKLDTMKELVKKRVPAKAVDANMRAFDLGYNYVLEQSKK